MAVSFISKSVGPDASARVIVEIVNRGAAATTAAIRFADAPGGAGLATAAVPPLDAGAIAQVALDLPAGTASTERLFTVTADDEATVEDIDRSNNSVTFAIEAPIRTPPCTVDVDGDGRIDVATDIVYIARYLLDLSPVPPSFRLIDPTIPSDTEITARLDALGNTFDVDTDGSVEVATDVVYMARRLLVLPPVPASFRALDPTIPADAAIALRIDALCP